jgi:ADP-heptose:LPS heptosyltransferase
MQTNAEIHFLIKPAFAHVLHENPYIDHIHKLSDEMDDTIQMLKEYNFSLIIDLQKNLKSLRLSQALGAKTVRFTKLNVKKWLAVNLKINTLPKQTHLVDRYFESMAELNIVNDGQGLDYFIMPEDEYDAQELVKGMHHYQVLVLGATYFTKRIPYNKCQEIIDLFDRHTVLVGGHDVSELSKQLAIENPEKVVNFCGKVGLGVSAGLIKHASRVVTGDTGMMHIAAALQKDITVLWGNTIPEFGMYPYYGSKNKDKHKDLQVSDLSCRPCSKLGFDHCPKGHFRCMEDLVID